LSFDVGEPRRRRGHLDDDHRLRDQARGFVDRRRARHHDVRDPAFVAIHADRDAGTCVEGFTW
jgi:hypothetical protein